MLFFLQNSWCIRSWRRLRHIDPGLTPIMSSGAKFRELRWWHYAWFFKILTLDHYSCLTDLDGVIGKHTGGWRELALAVYRRQSALWIVSMSLVHRHVLAMINRWRGGLFVWLWGGLWHGIHQWGCFIDSEGSLEGTLGCHCSAKDSGCHTLGCCGLRHYEGALWGLILSVCNPIDTNLQPAFFLTFLYMFRLEEETLMRLNAHKVILCCKFCFTCKWIFTWRLENPLSNLLERDMLVLIICACILSSRVTALDLVALP